MGKFTYWRTNSFRSLNHWQGGPGSGAKGTDGTGPYGPDSWYFDEAWDLACALDPSRGTDSLNFSRVYTGAYSFDMSKFYFAAPNIRSKKSQNLELFRFSEQPTYFSSIPFSFDGLKPISKVYGYLRNSATTSVNYEVNQYGALFDLGIQHFDVVPLTTDAGNIKIVGPLNTITLTPNNKGEYRQNVMLPVIHSFLVAGSIARATNGHFDDETPEWLKGGEEVDMGKSDASFKLANWTSYGEVINIPNLLSRVIDYNYSYFLSHGVVERHDSEKTALFGRGQNERPINLKKDSSGWVDGNFGWNHAPFGGFNTAGLDGLYQNPVSLFKWSGSAPYYSAGGTYPLIDNTLRSMCYDLHGGSNLDNFVYYFSEYNQDNTFSNKSEYYGNNIVFPSGLSGDLESRKKGTYNVGNLIIGLGAPNYYSMPGYQYGPNGRLEKGLYCATVINLLQDYEIRENAIIATTSNYNPEPEPDPGPEPEPEPSDDATAKINSAVTWAVNIANDDSHGYDQGTRWGENGDYDCSSFVITAWENAGVPVKTNGASYTGNMFNVFIASGFKNVTSQINLATGEGLQKGDVLLNVVNHTAMAVDGSQIVQASINENNSTHGGQPGDQTGQEIYVRGYYNYPWDYVLRYVG